MATAHQHEYHLPLVGRSKRRSAKREALRVGGFTGRVEQMPHCQKETYSEN